MTLQRLTDILQGWCHQGHAQERWEKDGKKNSKVYFLTDLIQLIGGKGDSKKQKIFLRMYRLWQTPLMARLFQRMFHSDTNN